MNIGKEFLSDSQFTKLWSEIETELYKLYHNSKCSGLVVYNNIYVICTSISHKYIEELYWKLGDFLYERLRESRVKIFLLEDFIDEYTRYYLKYKSYLESINDLTDYLNQFITTKSLKHFGFLLWERCILQACIKYKGVSMGEYIVNYRELLDLKQNSKYLTQNNFKMHTEEHKQLIKGNSSNMIDTQINNIQTEITWKCKNLEPVKCKTHIKDNNEYQIIEKYLNTTYIVVQSFKDILLDPKYPLLYYQERYEAFALNRIKLKYDEFIANHNYKCVLEYTNLIYKYIKNERYESKRTLLKESWNKLDLILEDILVVQKKKYLRNEIYKILNQHKIPDDILNSIRNSGVASYSHCNNMKTQYSQEYCTHPINDYNILYNPTIPKIFTLKTDALCKIKKISKNLQIIRYGHEVLNNVFVKYLNSELSSNRHLLNKNIDSLYMFYILYKYVAETGFNENPNILNTLHEQFKQTYNTLNPNLSQRLLDYIDILVQVDDFGMNLFETVKGYEVDTAKTVIEKVDFYENNTVINMNEEDKFSSDDSDMELIDNYDNERKEFMYNMPGIDYKTSSLTSLTKDPVKTQSIENEYQISADDIQISKRNYINRNRSLPDLTKHHIMHKKDCLSLRVFDNLYKLVSNKVEFLRLYLTSLANRVLLIGSSYNKEVQIFDKIREYHLHNTSGSYEVRRFIKKGEIMFNDIKDMVCNKSNVHLLSRSAWPLEVKKHDIIYPEEIRDKIFINRKLVDNKIGKDNIALIYEYSTVEIEIQDNTYKCNFIQYLIINLFNKYDTINRGIINKETGLQGLSLESGIKSLLKCKLIEGKDIYVLAVSSDDTSEMINITDFYTEEDMEESHTINKDIYYQCTISRILKKRKELYYNELYEEISKQHILNFDILEEDIKQGISVCVNKGILEYANDKYIYIP